MRKECKLNLPDVQSTKINSIRISRVGVNNVDFPIYLKTKKGEKVLCYSKVNMYVSLSGNVKGISMSRLPRVLMHYRYKSFDRWVFWKFLYDLRKISETEDAYAEISFRYFMDKQAPVSKEKSIMAYECAFIGYLGKKGYKFQLRVNVLGTSLCPCSKEMSLVNKEKNIGRGAHNQRSRVTVTIETRRKRAMYIEDLIDLIESNMSCEIYPVLKRPDEKYVTEKAYKNPKFVEDIARGIATDLQNSKAIKWYKIKVQNEESIHAHDAVSYICRRLKGNKWIDAMRSL